MDTSKTKLTFATGVAAGVALYALADIFKKKLSFCSPSATLIDEKSADSSEAKAKRCLSIQSSVVYGYVGNKSSNFPLQLLGFDVDPVHTVQLSNHTGYAAFKGSRAEGEELSVLLEGMQANNFLQEYTSLITGYVGSVSFLEKMADLVEEMRKLNPSMVFVCDPVMGDQGKSYTPAGFNEIYRDRIIPFANVVTPNQTEAEKLSGIKIRTIEDAYKACQWFHDQGAHTVVITSLSCPSPASASSGADADATKPIFDATTPASEISTIDIIATTTAKHSVYPSSSPDAVTDAPDRYLHMSLPYFPTYFAGTGDLTTALLMAHLTKLSPAPGTAPPASSQLRQYPAILKEALQQTLCTVHAVIRSTLASNPEARELALVQAYRHILSPPSPAASLSSTEEVLGVSAESYGKPLFQLTEVFVNKNITE